MSNFCKHHDCLCLFMWHNETTTITKQIPEYKIKPKIIPKFADYNFVLPHCHYLWCSLVNTNIYKTFGRFILV